MAGEGTSAALSVCCFTRGPTARVAAGLALLREAADEIVVALDDRVDPRLAAPLHDVADTLVTYPYADPVDRPVGWIHSLCSGRWILSLDDDELPSAALVGALPELVAARDVTHYFLPRLWLFGDEASCLDEHPWQPDYQLRLVANDPRVLWFPGVTHWPMQAVGPHRYLETPILHTDLLLKPLDERRRKVAHYEHEAPGQRVAGLPLNRAYYLPEEREAVRLAALAPEDAEAVRAVLGAEPWPEPAAPPPMRAATREEIDAHWRGRPAGDGLYRARLEPLGSLDGLICGERRAVDVLVRNEGDQVWPWGEVGRPEIRTSYRWLDSEGAVEVDGGLRTRFPHAVEPGGSCLVPVDVIGPPAPGPWTLELDLVHEHVRWFGCGVRLEVTVRPARRVAILAESEAALERAARAVVETAPAVEPVLLASDPAGLSARAGYAAAGSARAFLLGGATSRAAARAGLLRRSLALLRASRNGSGPAGARPFLDTLASCDALLVVDEQGSAERRERWQREAAVLAARLAGTTVLRARDGDGSIERAAARLDPR